MPHLESISSEQQLRNDAYRITSAPGELREGLFGQIVLHTFEVLPYLKARGIFPTWRIASKLYGSPPDFTVIPGVFDLAYVPPTDHPKDLPLAALRATRTSILGGDWDAMHDLWHAYFRIPTRITEAANRVEIGAHTLGLHYRGQDKNALSWDTNPVTVDEFLTLAKSFLADRPDIDSMFIATDEFGFVEAARHALPQIRLINLGPVDFHKAELPAPGKADRALLDCVLLSRCAHVIKCSSALSGFAKVLRPDLPMCRVAACKLFTDVPYFPDAYVPPMSGSDAASSELLRRLLKGDWLDDADARARFARPFGSRPRFSLLRKTVRWLKYQRRRLRGESGNLD
jgi:hypothetical protein